MSPYPCKTAEQKTAEAAYAKLIADHVKADRLYDALPQTQGGLIISTDFARYLDPLYAKDPLPGKPRDLAPSWNHAYIYAQGRLIRELAARKHRRKVRFMSGGMGAGKTHALEKMAGKVTQPDLVWDGTLSDQRWAEKMIDSALTVGWYVHVFHVHRNVELALYGAIERGKKEGRNVPLAKLPGNHRQVQVVVANLVRRYATTDRVSITLVHNTGTSEVPGRALIAEPKDLAFRGALHYSSNYEKYHSEAADRIHAAP